MPDSDKRTSLLDHKRFIGQAPGSSKSFFGGFMAKLKEKRVKDTLTVYPIQREKIRKTSYEHLTIIFDKKILKQLKMLRKHMPVKS